jgi:hypothetical protein
MALIAIAKTSLVSDGKGLKLAIWVASPNMWCRIMWEKGQGVDASKHGKYSPLH